MRHTFLAAELPKIMENRKWCDYFKIQKQGKFLHNYATYHHQDYIERIPLSVLKVGVHLPGMLHCDYIGRVPISVLKVGGTSPRHANRDYIGRVPLSVVSTLSSLKAIPLDKSEYCEL